MADINRPARRRRDDEEKLLPGWGVSGDWQIIALGLVTLAVILGATFVWPRFFGGESPLGDVAPDLNRPSEVIVVDGDDDIISTPATTTQTTETSVFDTEPDTDVDPVVDGDVDLTPDVAASVSGFDGVTGTANGTVAILAGFVGTQAQSDEAEAEAAAVAGITEVDNRLVVLEQDILDAANAAGAGLEGAEVEMNGTNATLRGLVSNELDAATAIAAAESIEGISPPVVNELRILQPEVDTVVADLGLVEGGESPVETDASADPVARVVTLTGTVATEEDSAAVETAARSVDGVTEVINLLEVSGPSGDDVTSDLNALFELTPIQFRSGSDAFLPESIPTLDRAVAILNEAPPGISLEVQGYTDTSGGTEANQRLSERRAAAVAQYLIDGGVTAELTSSGKGETETFGPELIDNRRVVFVQLP